MFVEEIRRAVMAAPRMRLAELQAVLWKAHAVQQVGDDEAQELAELIQARKAIPAPTAAARRHVGSRPISSASIARRRRWCGSGWLDPHTAAHFSIAEQAVLAVIATEVAKSGQCRLAINHIASLAGVGRTSVQNTLRAGQRLGVVKVEVRRLSYARCLPNVVTITSRELAVRLRGARHQVGDRSKRRMATSSSDFLLPATPRQPDLQDRNRRGRMQNPGRHCGGDVAEQSGK